MAGRDTDDALSQAHAALDLGDIRTARALAQQQLHAAEAAGDVHLQAKALACLAYADRLVSRIRRAHDTSRRAARLFQQVGDIAGESMALATVSHSASSLGRNEEAVEAALLSVQLSALLPLQKQQALAQNYLGVAYFWSRSFDKAAAAFEASALLARSCSPPASPAQPMLNRVWCEAVRVVSVRHDSGELPPLDRIAGCAAACDALFSDGDTAGILPGFLVTSQAVWHLTSGLTHCWHGDLQAARGNAEQARGWIDRYGTVTWLDALEAWLHTEIAWARRSWFDAEQAVARMVGLATQVEHEQLACMGHMLTSQVLEIRGKHAQALAEVRLLRRREQRIRAESLESRARVVKWQIEVRSNEEHLHKLEAASRQFERLSLEDSLTGLANRRRFERELAERLAAGEALCVALVDIDKFKQINDGHSHMVGDQVLKSVASILGQQVREQDLAARLAGDEFVVLLRQADAQSGRIACGRLASAVRTHDWSGIAARLHVSISVGCACAEPGDTVETLLARADAAMYAVKQACSAEKEGARKPL